MFGVSATHFPKSRGSKSPKASRKASPEPTPAPAAPGFMVMGPDGRPIFAPVGHFAPSQEARSSSSRYTGARTAHTGQLAQGPPSNDIPHPPYPPRYYPMPDEMPPRQSFNRSPDELFIPRARAASTAHFSFNPYASRPESSSSGRRNVSGPADVSYMKIPRKPTASPLAEHPPRARDHQDQEGFDTQEAIENALGSDESEDEDDEDEGVKVEVVADPRGTGYSVDRGGGGGAGGGDNAARRRRRK